MSATFVRPANLVLLSLSILAGCGGGATSFTSPPPAQTPPPAPQVMHYTVIGLPPLPGEDASQAQGLNSAGDVVGYSVADYHAHAVIWKNGVPEDLGTPDSFANAVNTSDQIAGYATSSDGTPHAFLWTEQDGAQDLGTLPGFDSSAAEGINDSGVVVGVSFSLQSPNDQQGFTWTKASGMQSIPGALSALAINRTGQVAGLGSTLHAALFAGGQMTDMGTIGPTSVAVAVNSSGRAVGLSTTHAFLFDGTIRDLGLRDNWTSAGAAGINDAGTIVGSALSSPTGNARVTKPAAYGRWEIAVPHDAAGGVAHPFIWTASTGLTDLNTLMPANSGWSLVVATGINAKGQIAGLGQNANGDLHAVLLNPN